MIQRRRFLTAAILPAFASSLLVGCGESGGVSSIPVKGDPNSAGGTTPLVRERPSTPAAPAGSASKGGKKEAPLDVVE